MGTSLRAAVRSSRPPGGARQPSPSQSSPTSQSASLSACLGPAALCCGVGAPGWQTVLQHVQRFSKGSLSESRLEQVPGDRDGDGSCLLLGCHEKGPSEPGAENTEQSGYFQSFYARFQLGIDLFFETKFFINNLKFIEVSCLNLHG